MAIPVFSQDLPHLSVAQMIEVDRAMMEDLRIELIQMMENAGRALAHLARERFLDGDPRGRRVVVLAGTGGNGGGAMVGARRLCGWGASVQVRLSAVDEDLAPVPRHQLDILRRMQVPVVGPGDQPGPGEVDLVLDGLIGYSLRGAPREAVARLIRWANDGAAPILSLDAPSGVDGTSGAVFEPAVRATATMTLALPKVGLRADAARPQVGELYLADIGVPPSIYDAPEVGVARPDGLQALFARSDVVRIA